MIVAVIGSQYGSEGKGVVVHRMALDQHYSFHVRVGGPNAGHSFIHNKQRYVLQSVPVGFVDPESALVLGAGAVINPRILADEIAMLENLGHKIRDRLFIDANATVLTRHEEEEEGHTDGTLHQRIGSTGEGVGAARHKRMRRDASRRCLVHEYPAFDRAGTVTDTVDLMDRSTSILLEGTQGSGLSLTHGPWPYCTSADTNAAQLCADAGVAPKRLTDVMLVARTMPIRVAGNSGPLRGETSFTELSVALGRDVQERTTVTKKVRRIGTWDAELFRRAVLLNGPRPQLALTFADYINPEDEFVTDWQRLSQRTADFIARHIETENVDLKYIGTGMHPERGWTYVEV